MTTEQRFEMELPDRLADLAMPVRPDYRDDIVRQTASMRQRPAWTLPERWIPMSITASRVAVPPRFPWRILVVAALILAVAAAALLVVGSRPHLPAPFGPAADGLVAYSAKGDIYMVDPTTGRSTAVIAGSDADRNPIFSRDGTHIAFERLDPGTDPGNPTSRLLVASSDGTGVLAITPTSLKAPGWFRFSPDGRQVSFLAMVKDSPVLMVANTDGSGVRTLDVGMAVKEPTWLPPDGREILVASVPADSSGAGLYAVDVQTGKSRVVLAPRPGFGADALAVSPDGKLIAYSQSDFAVTDRNPFDVHMLRTDGTGGDIALPKPAGAVFQDASTWSNDGTHLAVIRGYSPYNQDVRVAILPADGSGTGVETAKAVTGCCDNLMEWAPDDSAVMLMPEDISGASSALTLVDPATGRATVTSWGDTSFSSWQRLAR
jgi:Tol biopolymer transport system component